MRDLLDSTLEGWFSYLASWQPPGIERDGGCNCCADSVFMRVAGLDSTPHDVAHALIRELNSAVRLVQLSLEELDEANLSAAPTFAASTAAERVARREYLVLQAEALVLTGLRDREDAMRDVLDQCIEPVLERFLRSECERGLLELFATDDRDRPAY